MPPHYPLKEVKRLLTLGHVRIKDNAFNTAWNDFGWRPREIIRCLLKLNCKDYAANPRTNHFHKKAPHDHIPNTMMDYYKAVKIMEGQSVYTHFYIDSEFQTLVISSFKRL